MVLKHIVTQEEAGTALLLILRRSMGLSSAAVKALKRHGGLEVDGVLRFTTYLVSPGEVVTADVTQGQNQGDNIPETGPLEVLWEEEGLLAVNKPAGLIVHPTHSRNHGTLANFVAGYLEQTGQRPTCHIVNRLDRDTSGLVLFAKNAYMKDWAQKAVSTGEKWYTALAFGTLTPPCGEICLPIRRLAPRDMYRIVAEDGKSATTQYETLEVKTVEGQAYSLLNIRLITGRTHQIRVHSLACGAPLLGDPLYFTPESSAFAQTLGLDHQLLHSHRLCFRHPFSGEDILLEAPIRDAKFQGLL